MNVGSSDLAAAAAALRSRLPEPLAALAGIAYNYRWSWTPGGPELLASIDPDRFQACAGNPVRLLQEVQPAVLDRLAGDAGFLERLGALDAELTERLRAPLSDGIDGISSERPAAFF